MKNIKTFEKFLNEEFGIAYGIGLGVIVGLTGYGIQELIKLSKRAPTKKLINEIMEMINRYKDDEIISDLINKIENNKKIKNIDFDYFIQSEIKDRLKELMEPDEFRELNNKIKKLDQNQLYNINLKDSGIFQM